MKKGLFSALAATMAFAACTNEELIQQISVPGVEGEMVTLSENFAIGATRGEDAATRAQYDGNVKIQWTPQLDDMNKPIINKVGFAWKGQVPTGKVYTNYMFEHFAFERNGAVPKIDECVGWENLIFLTEDDFNSYGNGNAANGYVNGWAKSGSLTTFTTSAHAANTSKAFFKTENLTIFGGDYVAYMPYDPSFIDAGYLYAKSPAVFEDMNVVSSTTDGAVLLEHVADYHFYAAQVPSVKGGTTANGFNLQAVTGNVILKFVNQVKNDNTNWQDITKVAVYGPQGIVVEQALNADDLSLIEGTTGTSTSLMANLSTEADFNGNAAGNATYYVAMTALPQTIKNFTVVLFNKDGKSCSYNCGEVTVKRNGSTTVTVPLAANNPLDTDVFYVVDMETFKSSMTVAATETNPNKGATLQLINDIVFDKAYTTGGDGKIWINRDMEIKGGNITIPAGQVLQLGIMRDQVNVTIDGAIKIEKTCCGKPAAEVSVIGYNNNAGVANESTIEFKQKVDIEEGTSLTIGNGLAYVNAKFVGDVTNHNVLNVIGDVTAEFGKLVNNKSLTLENIASSTKNDNHVIVAELTNAEDATVAVNKMTTLTATSFVNNGSLSIANSGTNTDGLDGTVNVQTALENNGLIENYGVYNSNGTTTLKDKSTFIDYVGSQYGNKMPTCVAGYEYICEVNTSDKTEGDRLAYALNSKMPTTIVKFVTTAAHTYQLSDYAAYDKLATVDYVIAVDGANFDFNNNSEDEITLGGDVTVEEVGQLTFRNSNDGAIKVGANLDIETATEVRFIKGTTTVAEDLTVASGAIYNAGGTSAAIVNVGGDVELTGAVLTAKALLGATAANEHTTESWTIGGNVDLKAGSTMTVNEKTAVSVKGNLSIAKTASAVFAYSSYTEFDGTIVNNGTFNRELSSGLTNANPAIVWCAGYTNNGTQVNGAAQVANN